MRKTLGILLAVLWAASATAQMMDNPYTESGRVVKNAAGQITIDWESLLLTNGEWKVSNNADSGTEIVNWQTMTNWVQTAAINPTGQWNFAQTPQVQGTNVATLTDLNELVTEEQTFVFSIYQSEDAPNSIQRDQWDCWEFIDTAERASWWAFEVPSGIDTNTTQSIGFDTRVGDPEGTVTTTVVWRLQIFYVANGELTTKSPTYTATNVVSYGTTMNQTKPLIFTNIPVVANTLLQGALRRMTGDARDEYDGHIEAVKSGNYRYRRAAEY